MTHPALGDVVHTSALEDAGIRMVPPGYRE
jgi:hypothetical protein